MNTIIAFLASYLVFLPPVILAVVFLRLKQDKRIEIFVLAVVSTIITALLVKIATTVHQDPRPFIRDGIKPLVHGSTDNGFPSDHSAFSAMIAFIVLKFNRKVGYALLAVSLVICVCRVLAGVHHVQDVVGGVIIAAIGVWLSMLLIDYVERKRRR